MKCRTVFLVLAALALVMSAEHGSIGSSYAHDDDKTAKFTPLNFYRGDLDTEQIKTLESFRKIEGAPAYVIDFTSYYRFDAYLKVGGYPFPFLFNAPPQNNVDSPITCSTFSASTPEGEALHAYNQDFDSDKVRESLILFTSPEGGYKSISQSRSDFTMSTDFYKNPETLLYRNSILCGPYCPFDGMNEFGLCVSPMYVNSDKVRDPNKITLSILGESRLILDYARDVDEAIELLDKYNNLASDQQHILISDVYGNSAVIEYFRGQMIVTRNRYEYQVCTNFPIDGYGDVYERNKRQDFRYLTAEQKLNFYNGTSTEEQAFGILESIAQRGQATTYWSSVANKTKGTFDIYYHLNYKDKYQFDLPMTVDLKVNAVKKNKKQIKRGNKVQFSVEVQNDSPRYSKDGKVSLYLSKRNYLYKNSIKLITADLRAMKNNETFNLKVKAVIPKDIRPTDYYLIARIEDLPNRDTDKSNDMLSSPEKFTVK